MRLSPRQGRKAKTRKHRLEHSLRHAAEAAEGVARFLDGVTEHGFISSEKDISSVRDKMCIVGMACTTILNRYRAFASDHAWLELDKFKEARDIISHEYAGVEAKELWRMATEDIPALQRFLLDILKEPDQLLVYEERRSRAAGQAKGALAEQLTERLATAGLDRTHWGARMIKAASKGRFTAADGDEAFGWVQRTGGAPDALCQMLAGTQALAGPDSLAEMGAGFAGMVRQNDCEGAAEALIRLQAHAEERCIRFCLEDAEGRPFADEMEEYLSRRQGMTVHEWGLDTLDARLEFWPESGRAHGEREPFAEVRCKGDGRWVADAGDGPVGFSGMREALRAVEMAWEQGVELQDCFKESQLRGPDIGR